MTAEAQERFGYRVQEWWPRIRWYDWFPGVGLVTMSERHRRDHGRSLSEEYLQPLTNFFHPDPARRKEHINYMMGLGVANWPQPDSQAAYKRSMIMAIRNMAFPSYHFLLPLYAYTFGPEVIRIIETTLQR